MFDMSRRAAMARIFSAPVALAVPTAAIAATPETDPEPRGERISRLMEELSDALSGTGFRAVVDPADVSDGEVYMLSSRRARADERLFAELKHSIGPRRT